MTSTTKPKYILVDAKIATELTAKISMLMEDGYAPHGSPLFSTRGFHQAVVLTPPKQSNNPIGQYSGSNRTTIDDALETLWRNNQESLRNV